MMRKVEYNSQRDNFSFAGQFPGWKQCFSTSAWMLISFFSPKANAKDDGQLAWYLDQVEAGIGETGIAEEVLKTKPYIAVSGSSYWFEVQRTAIEKILNIHGVQGQAVYREGVSWTELDEALKVGPCIVGTMRMGGLPGGHIILVNDREGEVYSVNDPYGNPLTNYRDTNGEAVQLPKEFLKSACERAISPGKIRFIYWKTA